MPIQFALSRSVPPANEPVTRADLKGQARIVATDTCQDAEIDRYIMSAREQFEVRTDQVVMQQTWLYQLPYLKYITELPHPPLQLVTSLEYLDTDNTPTTIPDTDYQVITGGYPGLLVRNLSTAWPTDISQDVVYPFTITFVAGHAVAKDVSPNVKQAILMLATYFYENRVTAEQASLVELPHAFEAIVAQHRVFAR